MKLSVTTILYLSIIGALFFPFGQETKDLILPLLMLLMFLSFSTIQIKLNNFKRIEILYFGLTSLVVLPFLVWLLTYPLEESLRLGLFIAAIAPPAISSPVIIQLIKGDATLGLVNGILYSLLCPITISILLGIYFGNSSFELPLDKILKTLFLVIFIPLLSIKLLERFFPTILTKVVLPSKKITPYLFIFITSLGIAATRDYIFEQNLKTILIALSASFLLAFATYGIGFLYPNQATRRAMIVTSGYKSISLLVGVGTLYFTDAILMIIVMYLIAQQLINGFILWKFKT